MKTDKFVANGSKTQILLVEPSSTMRHVVQNYAEGAGHTVESLSSYGDAATALKSQFDDFDPDIDCVLLGWPTTRDRESNRLLGMLEGVDYHDLPVIVLSQDMRPDSRAWVAARDHCVMIRWKDYRAVDGLVEKLLDDELTDNLASNDSDLSHHQDIHILVVDDSATIRHALHDLLRLHGYTVSVAGTAEESLELISSQDIDLCLIDFYLKNSTGDELCRQALALDGKDHLICAILTATYTDQVIKHSLAAGAIECLYKNEASELLLARINALGQLIRKRRSDLTRQKDMSTVIDAIAGSVIVFNQAGGITYINDKALSVLGRTENPDLGELEIGRDLCEDLINAAHGKRLRGQFKVMGSDPVEVLYKCSEIRRGGDVPETVVVFRTEDEVKNNNLYKEQGIVVSDSSQTVAPEKGSRAAFLEAMTTSRRDIPTQGGMLTFLLLDVGYVGVSDKRFRSVAESPSAATRLVEALRQVYRRENHVVYLDDGKFGILLKHNSNEQGIVLTRKIMQIANSVGKGTGLGEFSSSGALISLDRNPSLESDELIHRLLQGLKLLESKGRNNALLLDLKRLFPVYPQS